MGADNADYAGPWVVYVWPLESSALSHIRVSHAMRGVDVIDLTGDQWACESYRFRDEHYYLDLVLVNTRTGERATGTFEMVRGVWRSNGGHGAITLEQFHATYGGTGGRVLTWPSEPFKYVHPPTDRDVRSADGRFVVDLTTNRWKMSDWIHPPRVIDTANGDVLLDLRTTYWDARATFVGPHTVQLVMLRYPESRPSLTVELDLHEERYRVVAGNLPGRDRVGFIDELQAAIGRPPAELAELGQCVEVRASRREQRDAAALTQEQAVGAHFTVETPGATGDTSLSSDGQFALSVVSTQADGTGTPRDIGLCVRSTATGETPLDLSGTTWRTTATWIGACNQLRVAIADEHGTPRLTVKIDFDCLLYWEEAGPDFGLPDGSPVQAAPLWELQERLTLEPGVIRRAERSPETGMMWPARAFQRAAMPPREEPVASVSPTIPAASSLASDAPRPAAYIAGPLERTILFPACRLELFPSGATTKAASGESKPYYFVRIVSTDGRVLADTRGTSYLAWIHGATIELHEGIDSSRWIALDPYRGEFWWENYREPLSATLSIETLRDEIG